MKSKDADETPRVTGTMTVQISEIKVLCGTATVMTLRVSTGMSLTTRHMKMFNYEEQKLVKTLQLAVLCLQIDRQQ